MQMINYPSSYCKQPSIRITLLYISNSNKQHLHSAGSSKLVALQQLHNETWTPWILQNYGKSQGEVLLVRL